jgi:hypothetical protein
MVEAFDGPIRDSRIDENDDREVDHLMDGSGYGAYAAYLDVVPGHAPPDPDSSIVRRIEVTDGRGVTRETSEEITTRAASAARGLVSNEQVTSREPDAERTSAPVRGGNANTMHQRTQRTKKLRGKAAMRADKGPAGHNDWRPERDPFPPAT